jgi:hypothetical protein
MDDSTPLDPIHELEHRRHEERLAVDEAGGGESEGFELAEQELIEHTSHGDEHTPARIIRDAAAEEQQTEEQTEEQSDSVYGEADEEHTAD